MPKPLEVPADEPALVSRAIGEPEAFGVLYDRYFPRIYNYMRYRIENRDAADDLTARLFEKVLTNLPRYRLGAIPFAVWLFRIARNLVLDYQRGTMRRQCLPLDQLPEQESDATEPVDRLIEDETRAELLAAIHRLHPWEQEILALKFTAGLTNREIARTTGLGESNVGVTLYRIIRRLRAELCGGESNA